MAEEKINLLFLKYRTLFNDFYFRKSAVIGFVSLLAAVLITGLANYYADQAVGNPVGDLLLDNLPTRPLFGLLLWATFGTAFLIIAFVLFNPEYLPAVFKSATVLYITRAIFISLTHLKVRPEKIIVNFDYQYLANLFSQGNDLFFSGHVALPVMAALIFWDKKWFRSYLIFAALLSALVVLLRKSHYSIDVFAAPLITYSLFSLSQYWFKKDFSYTQKDYLKQPIDTII